MKIMKILYTRFVSSAELTKSGMLTIAATDVLRVLQRIAEGQSENFEIIDDGDLCITLAADGWVIDIWDDAGQLDYVERAVAPDGSIAEYDDWGVDCDPMCLLAEAYHDAILALIKDSHDRQRLEREHGRAVIEKFIAQYKEIKSDDV